MIPCMSAASCWEAQFMKRLTGSKWAQGTWGGGREWGWDVAILAKALHSGAKVSHLQCKTPFGLCYAGA